MGCSISHRRDPSPIITLCRDRRHLIHSAANSRFALADAHSAYFHSLNSVNVAFNSFISQEMTILPSSPILNIPSSSSGKGSKSTSNTNPTTSVSTDQSYITYAHGPTQVNYMRPSTTVPDVGYVDPPYVYTPYTQQNVADDPYAYAYYDERRRREAVGTPPPPPPAAAAAGGSVWDIFNPFYDYQPRYGVESVVSSLDSSEAREQEGIPELEEDTDVDIATRKIKKGESDSLETESSSAEDRSKRVEGGSDSHEIESSSAEDRSSHEIESSSAEEGKVVSNGESTMVTEESGVSIVDVEIGHGIGDVMEAVEEVREQFKAAAGCGEEVARMLEVGRVPYRSRCGVLTVIYSNISGFKHQRLSSATHLKNKTSYADIENHIAMKSGNLSSTMEKLYMWEKKLYKEVKVEEELRIMYNKKWRQLKDLDDRGGQTEKIDYARESIKKLCTKISVVIRSIATISSMVHKIRDEELQPQLIELIQGLIEMWRLVLDCHQKQFQALVNCKSYELVAKPSSRRDSVARATRDLEIEVQRWCSCFTNWIKTQRSYIESLNGWLQNWINQEPEVTADGVAPFSPSKVGAPAAFVISNDWYHAIEKLPEAEVTKSMRSFAAILHEMRESQKKEHRQKLKAEYLSRDYARKLKSLQKENEMTGNLGTTLTNGDAAGNISGAMKAVESLMKRLDEERAKHEEIRKHIQHLSSSFLGVGLVPIFDSLRKFTSETVKAYGKVRIQSEGEGT